MTQPEWHLARLIIELIPSLIRARPELEAPLSKLRDGLTTLLVRQDTVAHSEES